MGDVQSIDSRSGRPVLIVRGCATASSVDPMTEAERWLRGVEWQIRDLSKNSRIGVLGLGSGYHVNALAQAIGAPIDVFESDAALMQHRAWYEGKMQSSVRLHFIRTDDGVQKFFAHSEVQSFVSQRFILLKHKPSFIRDQRGLTTLLNWLTARDRQALPYPLNARRDLAAMIDTGRVPSGDWLLSVKDLNRAWNLESEVTEQRRMFRILEELVR